MSSTGEPGIGCSDPSVYPDRSPNALAARVVATLRDRSQTLATAESLTGGLLGAAITEVPGASAVYRGGLITYATELKAALAGVPEQMLSVDGPVAPTTAARLAHGAARVCAADWGLATTGVAGPEPQDGHPVGQVFVAVAGPAASDRPIVADGPLAAGRTDDARDVRVRELALSGDRALIRQQAVVAVLDLLLDSIG